MGLTYLVETWRLGLWLNEDIDWSSRGECHVPQLNMMLMFITTIEDKGRAWLDTSLIIFLNGSKFMCWARDLNNWVLERHFMELSQGFMKLLANADDKWSCLVRKFEGLRWYRGVVTLWVYCNDIILRIIYL